MIIPLIGLGLVGFGLICSSKENTSDQLPTSGGLLKKRLYDLPDINSNEQGGVYTTAYDYIFEAAADKYSVPFALLKSHAIAESSLNPKAIRNEPDGSASYGLMQLLWKNNKSSWMYDRFSSVGMGGDVLSKNISTIYEPIKNVEGAADLIAKNLKACKGNLRDAINMYNTGAKESVRIAPHNYIEKVLGYYQTIIKRKVTLT